MSLKSNNTVFCFGEVLWDIFPDGTTAGGAPFNVAYNLRKMGVDSRAISRVGNDSLGIKLQNQIKAWGFPEKYLQIDATQPTGTVLAHFDADNEAHYDIVYPVAYDFIANTEGLATEVSQAAAFVFGSLIARGDVSRTTLFSLLEAAKLKIFDVNLREPYCDFKLIEALLHQSDIVKMNKAEMKRLLEYLTIPYTNEQDAIFYIQDFFKLEEVLISKGSKGALYHDGRANYEVPALPIEIADTVGSGDAFLAGFISKRIQNAPPQEIMKRAVALGAFITSKAGACPDYKWSDFEKFESKGAVVLCQ
ncbi:carbohydrate kinase family protein [Flavobacterium sp. SM2513]|uniref:carbohydrate kinase family protein n=1 Tax=Flavobacterium sp. SM2513 TaxID=3424766 RepID=UPI003D7F34C9